MRVSCVVFHVGSEDQKHETSNMKHETWKLLKAAFSVTTLSVFSVCVRGDFAGFGPVSGVIPQFDERLAPVRDSLFNTPLQGI
jgi:hypothetical protein